MGIIKRIIITVLAVSAYFVSAAQLSVEITGDFDGCAPQNLTFGCNLSGAGGDVTYSWSSGTGDVSVLATPTFSYINAGHYTLSVTVTSGGQTATDSKEVVIFRGPTANFDDTPRTGCVPYDFEAQSLSTPGDAPITAYHWFYNDGYSSTEESSTHTYQSSGVYPISLEITDANGCVDNKTSQQVLTLSKNPTVSITAHDAQWCTAPHEVRFNSEISTSGGLGGTYTTSWNFGDGATSSTENPNHTYSQTGTYDVSLTVADSYGCSTTVLEEEMVVIGMLSPTCNVPEQVCLNQNSQFSSNADGECTWNFGDGTTEQSGASVYHTYTQAGYYTVTFTVDPNGPCRRTLTFHTEVVRVEASFVTSPTNLFSCSSPFDVQFTSTSVGDNLTYYYSFGDSRIETDANVIHTYTGNGEYTPTLTVTSPGGCSSRFTGPTIVIREPAVSLSLSEEGGCIPLLVNLSDGADASGIVDFLWDYGDGTPTQHTDVPSSEHYYQNVGTYFPSLTVRDTAGCTATYSGDSIITGTPILPEQFGVMDSLHNFIPKATICASDTVVLYNSMYEDHDTLEYVFIIEMNGSPYEEKSDETYHDYSFENDTGWAYVGLRVDYNKCKSDTLWWDSVYVAPPIVKIQSSSDCQSPLEYVYRMNKNIGAEFWDWIITNETTGDTLRYVQHSTVDSIEYEYPINGRYQCKIIAYNMTLGGCEYEDKVSSEITAPVMDWTISRDTICANNRINLNIADAAAFSEVAYTWGDSDVPVDIDDLEWLPTSALQSTSHQYPDSGNYDITIYGRQSNGCVSVFSRHIYVVKAQASIIPASQVVGCAPATFEFEVVPETQDPLQWVSWDFGDGSSVDTTYTPNVPVGHTYTDVGMYRITMRLSTEHGCRYSKVFSNRVRVVESRSANVSIDDADICLGTQSTFTSSETDYSVWHEWYFGDGSEINTGHNAVVNHTYAEPGHYTVRHIVSEQSGESFACADTMVYENAVTVETLTVDFELDSTLYNCYPISPVITSHVDYAPSDINVEYNWNMGNGEQNIHIPNPEYLYTVPGVYDISLDVLTPAGCSASATHGITVTGPEASIYLSDTVICAGGTINMAMMNAQNVENVVWVVGGGNSYTTPQVTHTYDYVPASGYFPVTMSIRNGHCTIDLTEQVYVYRLTTEFALKDNDDNIIGVGEGVCTPLIGRFEPEHSADCTSRWYVNGDLVGSENVNWVNESLQNDIQFTVKNVVIDSLGCTDSITHEYYVYHLPELYVSNDTTVCLGDTVRISANGANSYYWADPIADSLPNYELVPEETTVYYVDAYSEKRCVASDSVSVNVIPINDISLSDDYLRINMGDTAIAFVIYDSSDFSCFISPEESVRMAGCDTLIFFPQETSDYVLVTKDTTVCPDKKFDIHIEVDKIFTLDVPGAFTPLSEGDGNNIVYARGLGIKNLLQFRIYNRWGEEVFFTDDLNVGWDGTVNDKVQNSDTYSYYVEAEMFDGSIQTKKGNIMLIR